MRTRCGTCSPVTHSVTHRLLICAGVCYKWFDMYVNPRAGVLFLAASSRSWCVKLFSLKSANNLLDLSTFHMNLRGLRVIEMGNTSLICSLFWGTVRSFSSLVPDECSFLARPSCHNVPKTAADKTPVTSLSCSFEEFSLWFFYYSLILFCICLLIALA